MPNPNAISSTVLCHSTKQLRFQYELSLLVLLARFVGLVVLPTYGFVTLLTQDISHDMSTSSHISLHGLGLFYVDDSGEEEGFAVLASEVA